MKHLLVLSVIFATAAFGAVSDPYLVGEKGPGNYYSGKAAYDIWDQLITSDSEWSNWAIAFSGDYGYWLADDYVVDAEYYYDMWNAIPNREFTNTAVHLSPQGSHQFAQLVSEAILEVIQDGSRK